MPKIASGNARTRASAAFLTLFLSVNCSLLMDFSASVSAPARAPSSARAKAWPGDTPPLCACVTVDIFGGGPTGAGEAFIGPVFPGGLR